MQGFLNESSLRDEKTQQLHKTKTVTTDLTDPGDQANYCQERLGDLL